MWIRSQDKENLANANEIEIFEYERVNGEVWIYVNDQKYAVYSTKEKALKVLDMIQKRIYLTDNMSMFQMPQDDKVE